MKVQISRRKFIQLSASLPLVYSSVIPTHVFSMTSAMARSQNMPINSRVLPQSGHFLPGEEKSLVINQFPKLKTVEFEINSSPTFVDINPSNTNFMLITDLSNQKIQLVNSIKKAVVKVFFPSKGHTITGRARYTDDGKYILIGEAKIHNLQGEMTMIDSVTHQKISRFSTMGQNPFEYIFMNNQFVITHSGDTLRPSFLTVLNHQGKIRHNISLGQSYVQHNHLKPDYLPEQFHLWKQDASGNIIMASHSQVLSCNVRRRLQSTSNIKRLTLNPSFAGPNKPLFSKKGRMLHIQDENNVVVIDTLKIAIVNNAIAHS